MLKNAFLVILLALATNGVWAAKVTTDPNLGQRAASVVVESADPRLATKITYEAKQKRLYEIAADLKAGSGVVIGCGMNLKDWRVRDIPLTISVRDLPLGQLLQAIADCAHVTLGSQKTDTGRAYRFSRTSKQQQELDRWLSDRRDWGVNAFKSDWDRAVEFAKLTDNGFASEPKDDRTKSQLEYARTFAKFLGALGTGARDRTAAGESIALSQTAATGAVRPALDSLIAETWKAREASKMPGQEYVSFSGTSNSTIEPTSEDLKRGEVVLYTHEWSYPPMLVGRVAIPARNSSGNVSYSAVEVELGSSVVNFAIPTYAKGIAQQNRRIPDWPASAISIPDLVKLNFRDTDPEFVRGKVTFAAPKDNPNPTMADSVVALAQAAGINIVCEDFESHKMIWKPRASVYAELTAADALKNLSWSFSWYAKDTSRLVVGTLTDWPERHSRLVPASLIARLHQSLMKDGIGLDDAVPMATLDDNQVSEWITSTRELNCFIMFSFNPIKPLWAFYDSLSDDDKKAVRSPSGLALGKFDPTMVADVLRQCNSSIMRDVRSPDERAQRELPTDPKVVPELVMRITPDDLWLKQEMQLSAGGSSSSTSYSSVKPGDTQPPGKDYERKTQYWLEITGKRGGQTCLIRNQSPPGFPYRPLQWKQTDKGLTSVTVSTETTTRRTGSR